MTDPRNIAHDKKVAQVKKHHGDEIAPGTEKTPQPGKKTQMEHHVSDKPKIPDEAAPIPQATSARDTGTISTGRDSLLLKAVSHGTKCKHLCFCHGVIGGFTVTQDAGKLRNLSDPATINLFLAFDA